MLTVEHGLLAVIGGVLGAATGWGALRVLGLTGYGVPAATQVGMDVRVVLFVLGVTVFCALLFGAAPVMLALRQARGADLRSSERGAAGGRRSARLVTGLVALEVALAVMLVAGAGLMARTAMGLREVDVGFRSDHVLALQVTTPSARYQDRDAVLAFQDRFTAALEATPGVERTGIVGQLPLAGTSWSSQFKAEGWPAERVGSQIMHRRADQGYFEALGVPLRRGRLLEPRDRGDAPFAVVVNETFARTFFADEDPIGKRIAYDREPTPQSNWYEIVGVVGDQHQVSPGQAPEPEVFESRSQDWGRTIWVVMRTSVEPMSVVASVRATLREIDAAIPIAKLRTLDEVRLASMAREDSVLGLFTAFGGLALLLAAVGVYAVAAQSARQRTREIGIRLALGATASDIAKLVLGRGVVSVVVGLAVGLVATIAASRALESLLYGVEATDVRTIASVAVLLLGVGVIACWIPARWATRIDPVRSLKVE
ncbi:MAG: ABC transporter permease [Gemmatimonadaceae bacterium]|nr:ABC transporter permease [Gemmatimonadaceae bacterium]